MCIIPFALRGLSVGPDGAPVPFFVWGPGVTLLAQLHPRLCSVALPGFEFRSLSLSFLEGDEAKLSACADSEIRLTPGEIGSDEPAKLLPAAAVKSF